MNVPRDAVLLVRNLRHLDLDLDKDWPGVTAETFRAGKNAQVTQKQRLCCAEFVLFKLFEHWDYPIAKFRLRPCYPALEPRQSIKLRVVLFQMLSELKTNGVLPRECILRKTMLDDCVGEKFEEMLFLFSTIVLRKVLNKRDAMPQTMPAKQLATAAPLRESEEIVIQPLTLALTSALQASLRKRQHRRAALSHLQDTFLSSQSMLAERVAVTECSLRDSNGLISTLDLDVEAIKKQLRVDHNGDEVWLEIVLSGDVEQGREDMIEDEFDNIWNPTLAGQSLDYETSTRGLLAGLQRRVEAQQLRLQKWKAFQVEVSKRNEDLVVLTSPMKSSMKTPVKSPTKSLRKGRFERELGTPIEGSRKLFGKKAPLLVTPKGFRRPIESPGPSPLPSQHQSAVPSSIFADGHVLGIGALEIAPDPPRQPQPPPPHTAETGTLSQVPLNSDVPREAAVDDSRSAERKHGFLTVSDYPKDLATDIIPRPITPEDDLYARNAAPSSVFKTRSKLRQTFSQSAHAPWEGEYAG